MSFPSRHLVAISSLLLVLVAVLVFFMARDPNNTADRPLHNAGTSVDPDLQIERGKYLAIAGNCASCHTTGSDGFMAGGLAFETPFGTIYSTNITPDRETGIGDWSGAQFLASMRHGIRADGEHLYPVFPYTSFTKVTDEDIAAMFAYLKTIPAVRREAAKNELSFPFNQRSLMAVWKALYFDEGAYEEDRAQSAEWNRGAYMVEALAHCGACHSPRNFMGAEQADLAMTGGAYTDRVRSGALRQWSTPNLTSANSGLGIWPLEDITAYLKTGRNSFLETFGPMNQVILNSTRHLSDGDLDAMAIYLVSLPANETGARPATDASVLGMGRTLYNLHCGTCHLPTGLGDAEVAPRLGGGSLVVRASDPASLINVILDGPEPPDPPLPPRWRNPMEDFRYLLDDEEIAALASYVRSTWGNAGGEVTPAQVAAQR